MASDKIPPSNFRDPDIKVHLPVGVREATERHAAQKLYVGFRIEWCRPLVEAWLATENMSESKSCSLALS